MLTLMKMDTGEKMDWIHVVDGLNLAHGGLVVVDDDQGHGDDDRSGPGRSRRWFN